jgi:DNA modification methylase
MIAIQTDNVTVYQGDNRETIKQIPASSVGCVVTSPPYFGLRDYGVEGQAGRENTLDGYVDNLVAVFREVRRVLRDDGVVWLNLGDSYSGSWGNYGGGNRGQGKQRERVVGSAIDKHGDYEKRTREIPANCRVQGVKRKELIGVPWRVALALQSDGWFLRSDIIWDKPNPMTESTRDRCGRSHEYIFMLTKQERYFYDRESIKEISTNGVDSRYKRTVWRVPVGGYRGAHFATFPIKLITPMILAGTSDRGVCSLCGSRFVRVVHRERIPTRKGTTSKTSGHDAATTGNRDKLRHITRSYTTGWSSSCSCDISAVVGDVVFDPFLGSGTTAEAAILLGRRVVGCELNPEYIDLIRARLTSRFPLLMQGD